MNKYFITSDIHSFYTPLIESLNQAGFDKNNPEHILIVCGDIFDRGEETVEVYNFLRYELPRERRILIRGNHEYLLEELLDKQYPESHDFSNGTVSSVLQLANMRDALTRDMYYHLDAYAWFGASEIAKNKNILDWIFGDEWVDYYELGNYIFVHSFIPLEDKNSTLPSYYLYGHEYSYCPDWRNIKNPNMWEDASWGCPYKLFGKGLFDEEIKNNKVLVCGHWHSRGFHIFYENMENNNEIYFGRNLIALDACTVLSNHCNILVIDNGTCYDRFGNKLEVK